MFVYRGIQGDFTLLLEPPGKVTGETRYKMEVEVPKVFFIFLLLGKVGCKCQGQRISESVPSFQLDMGS